MKTLLLWLAGIGGLLIIMGTVSKILGVMLDAPEDHYVKWSDMQEAARLWKARQI
jgi:hypothetical protein